MPTPAQLAAARPGFFKIADLPDPIVVTIKDARNEEVGQDKEEKQVLHFVETPKKLVINGARGEQLSTLFGKDTEIIGQKVKLEVAPAAVGNRTQIIICISAPE